MKEYCLDSDKFICNLTNHRDTRSWSLGMNFASEERYRLPERYDFEVLNTNEVVEYERRREFYVSINVFFWQLSLGFILNMGTVEA